MSDQWETFCDVGYYHMWRLRRKTERGWNDGFHINTRDEAQALCQLLNKLEGEVDEAREQCSNLDDQVSAAMMVIRGLERERDEARATISDLETRHSATMLHTQSIVDEANELREQRDRLAEAIRILRDEAAKFVEGQNYSTGGQRGLVQTVNGAECVPLYDAIDFAGYALAAVEGGSRE